MEYKNYMQNSLYVNHKNNLVEIRQKNGTTTGVRQNNLWATSYITSCQFVKILKLRGYKLKTKNTFPCTLQNPLFFRRNIHTTRSVCMPKGCSAVVNARSKLKLDVLFLVKPQSTALTV